MSTLRLDPVAQRSHALLNLIHTWLLVSGSLALLAICAWVFFGVSGLVYATIFGGVSLYVASRVSPALVLRMYKAMPVGRERFPAGHEILDELVRRAGIAKRPKLYVLPSQMMNAFAVGRLDDSAICLTDKLIRSMSRRELAGVMAHEITHISNEDVRVMAIADMVSRFTSLMSTFGMISIILNIPAMLFGGATSIPWSVVLLLVFAPTIGGLLQMALSRTREYEADLGAVLLTGDPDGLASALLKLEKAQGRPWEGMVLPGGRVPNPSILRTHPLTSERIARINALKRDAMPGVGVEVPEMPVTPARETKPAPVPTPSDVPSRPSVPSIRPKWGRGEESRYSNYASLLGTNPVEPVAGDGHPDSMAADESLHPPSGKPRIRFRSGGVWW
ncbi:MAG: zinc metalloprotease HtpX [Nitratireductor sp.]